MRQICLVWLILMLLMPMCFATDIDTEGMTQELERDVSDLLPKFNADKTPDFWQAIKNMFFGAFTKTADSFRSSLRLCAAVLCLLLLCSIAQMGASERTNRAMVVAGAIGITVAMMGNMQSMIHLAQSTIEDISDYSACYLPIMVSATMMSGGVSSATLLYGGTVLFSQILMRVISNLLIPAVYFYIALATAEAALDSPMLTEIREFVGWLISKTLRITMYVFIAYMSITGVVSGNTDAATVKATKATLSGMIPVVGSIVSDASEGMIAGAMMLKNSVGVFGMLAVLAICILPFFKIGAQYLLLKVTASVSGTVGMQPHMKLLKSFSQAMGYLLGMCGAFTLLLLIASVCFLRVLV